MLFSDRGPWRHFSVHQPGPISHSCLGFRTFKTSHHFISSCISTWCALSLSLYRPKWTGRCVPTGRRWVYRPLAFGCTSHYQSFPLRVERMSLAARPLGWPQATLCGSGGLHLAFICIYYFVTFFGKCNSLW